MKMNLLLPIFLLAPVVAAAQLPNIPTGVTLSWEVPTSRENGEALPLSEIAGYQINGCNAAGPVVIDVLDGATTSYKMALATPFDCPFSIVSVDTSGLRSQPSESLRVSFNPPNAPKLNAIQIN